MVSKQTIVKTEICPFLGIGTSALNVFDFFWEMAFERKTKKSDRKSSTIDNHGPQSVDTLATKKLLELRQKYDHLLEYLYDSYLTQTNFNKQLAQRMQKSTNYSNYSNRSVHY